MSDPCRTMAWGEGGYRQDTVPDGIPRSLRWSAQWIVSSPLGSMYMFFFYVLIYAVCSLHNGCWLHVETINYKLCSSHKV